MIISGAKLMLIEFVTLNAFFLAFPGHDLAYILACILSIICGFGMRIVLLVSNKETLITKSVVIIHFFATVFISWVAYTAWLQLFKDVTVFKMFGLQLYLIFCSFLSVSILQQIDKVGSISIKEIIRHYMHKYVSDGDKEKKA